MLAERVPESMWRRLMQANPVRVGKSLHLDRKPFQKPLSQRFDRSNRVRAHPAVGSFGQRARLFGIATGRAGGDCSSRPRKLPNFPSSHSPAAGTFQPPDTGVRLPLSHRWTWCRASRGPQNCARFRGSCHGRAHAIQKCASANAG